MSFRTTYILFGLLGALVIVFGLALWLAPYGKIDSKYVLPSAHDERTKVKSDDIVKVEVERRDADVHFVFTRDSKGEKEFTLETPAGFRITSNLVVTLIGQVLEAKTEEGDLNTNLKDWGLDNPKGHITLTTDKGQELRIDLGDVQNNRLYITSSDKPKTPMVLKKSALDAAYSQLHDFRARDLITYRSDDIKSVKIEKPAKEKTERILLHSADGKWRYVEPKYGAADLDGGTEADAKGPTGVRAVLTALTGLRAEGKSSDAKDAKDKKEKKEPLSKEKEAGFWEDDVKDLKKYGLDSEDDATMVLEAKTDPASKDGQKVLIGKETADKSEVYFARAASDRHVVTVTKKSLDTFRELLANPEALRDRDLVRLPDKPDVIRVKYPDGETIELVRTGSGETPPNPHGFALGGSETWKLYRGKEKTGLNTDGEAVKKLIDALVSNKRQVKEFPTNPEDPALGLKDPNNLTVSLWTSGLKKDEKKKDKEDKEDKDKDKEKVKKEEKKEPEKKDGDRPELKSDTPDVELGFGRVDSKKLVAVKRRSGKDLKQTDVLKVLDSVLEIARADSLAYLEKTLSPFYPAGEGPKAVVKVTAEFDGKTTVAEKKKPDDASSEWVLKKPAEWEGRKGDNTAINLNIISALSNLTITRWESLKPTKEQLGRYGLNAPTAKITLGMKIDKKDSEVSLLVGGPTDDKNGVYAKKSDRDEVFVVNRNDLAKMKDPLLDLQVLDFQAGSVKAVKLTGWARRGKADVLELTREGATSWKAKDLPASVKVHTDQVDKLVEALVSLRAKKYVVFKTGPKDEHGMDTKKDGLEIELTLEDKDKKTEKITLTVGNPDGDGFFAVSNKQPGDVFTIGKGEADIFEKVKKNSELLAK